VWFFFDGRPKTQGREGKLKMLRSNNNELANDKSAAYVARDEVASDYGNTRFDESLSLPKGGLKNEEFNVSDKEVEERKIELTGRVLDDEKTDNARKQNNNDQHYPSLKDYFVELESIRSVPSSVSNSTDKKVALEPELSPFCVV